ncbi:MAG: bifunctional phosphoglucose/phosphomannose isomerase [Candidatus Helarchaeota archaeon]
MKSGLDDLDNMYKIDPAGMTGVIERFRDNLERARKIVDEWERSNADILAKWKEFVSDITHIIVVGMGGSAIGGNLIIDYLYDRLSIPVSVFREYRLPKFVNKNHLIIFVSYSGNTEETLSSFADAISRDCHVLTITSDGMLERYSRRFNIPFIDLPEGLPPRGAVPFLSLPLFLVLEKLGFVSGISSELMEVLDVIDKLMEKINSRVPTSRNLAKQIALKIHETIPIIYAPPGYASIARRYKCQINENSKNPSYWDVFSELNHNEVVGWEHPSALTKNFSVILLRASDETESIKARIELTRKIMLEPAVKEIIEINAMGKSKLSSLYSLMVIGDFISLYLAVLNGVDPMPVNSINRLKKELKDRVNLIEKIEKTLL